ncbi:MAG: peptide deformylase [Solirubrobacterales bacterium]
MSDENETIEEAGGTAVALEGGDLPVADGFDEETLRRRQAALAQVIQYGDPVLKSRSSEITVFDQALSDEIERMIVLMRESIGCGLAANQIGRLTRLLVFQTNADVEPQALINPQINWLSEETEVMVEGCLSIPRVVVEVERPLFARVRGQDRTGVDVLIEASGHEARILQHEIDHLNGVLILDRTERSQRRGALKALRGGESYSPPDDD